MSNNFKFEKNKRKKRKLNSNTKEDTIKVYKTYNDSILGEVTDLVSDSDDDGNNSTTEKAFGSMNCVKKKMKLSETGKSSENSKTKKIEVINLKEFAEISSGESSDRTVTVLIHGFEKNAKNDTNENSLELEHELGSTSSLNEKLKPAEINNNPLETGNIQKVNVQDCGEIPLGKMSTDTVSEKYPLFMRRAKKSVGQKYFPEFSDDHSSDDNEIADANKIFEKNLKEETVLKVKTTGNKETDQSSIKMDIASLDQKFSPELSDEGFNCHSDGVDESGSEKVSEKEETKLSASSEGENKETNKISTETSANNFFGFVEECLAKVSFVNQSEIPLAKNYFVNNSEIQMVRRSSTRCVKSIAVGTTSTICGAKMNKISKNNVSAVQKQAVISELCSVFGFIERTSAELNHSLGLYSKSVARLKTVWNFMQPYLVSGNLDEGKTNDDCRKGKGQESMCVICFKKMKRTQLKSHLWKSHKESAYKFQCSECTLIFKTAAFCQTHLKKCHSGSIIAAKVIRIYNDLLSNA